MRRSVQPGGRPLPVVAGAGACRHAEMGEGAHGGAAMWRQPGMRQRRWRVFAHVEVRARGDAQTAAAAVLPTGRGDLGSGRSLTIVEEGATVHVKAAQLVGDVAQDRRPIREPIEASALERWLREQSGRGLPAPVAALGRDGFEHRRSVLSIVQEQQWSHVRPLRQPGHHALHTIAHLLTTTREQRERGRGCHRLQVRHGVERESAALARRAAIVLAPVARHQTRKLNGARRGAQHAAWVRHLKRSQGPPASGVLRKKRWRKDVRGKLQRLSGWFGDLFSYQQTESPTSALRWRPEPRPPRVRRPWPKRRNRRRRTKKTTSTKSSVTMRRPSSRRRHWRKAKTCR